MSNIAVKITADTTSLITQLALAAAQSRAFSNEVNSLAKQIIAAGGATPELNGQLQKLVGESVEAKEKVAALKEQLVEGKGGAEAFIGGLESMRGGLEGLGLGISIGALASWTSGIEEAAASTAHEATVLQVTTAQLQAYHSAATDAGVETSAIDTALMRFDKSVSDAATGTGKGAEALNALGISARQSHDAILQQVSAAMLSADATTQAHTAFDLFGRTGAEMLPMWGKWAQGGDTLAKAFQAAGRNADPGLSEAMEQAEIQGKQLSEMFSTEGTESALKLAKAWNIVKFVGLTLMTLDFHNLKIDPDTGELIERIAKAKAQASATPAVKLVAPGLDEQIADLAQYDSKLTHIGELKKDLVAIDTTLALAEKSGSAAQIAAAQQAYADVKKELDAATKPEVDPNIRLAREAAEKEARLEIADAQEKISEINADETIGGAQRLAAIEAVYANLLNNAKLTAQQRVDIQKSENNAIAAANKADAQQQQEIAKNNADTTLQIAKINFQQQRDLLDQQVADGKITKQQELQDLIVIAKAESAAEIDAINVAEGKAIEGSAVYIENENKKLVVTAQVNAEIAKLEAELSAAVAASRRQDVSTWKTANDEILSAEDGLVRGIFSGRANLWQSLAQMSSQFIEKEIADDLKAATEHILLSDSELAADKAAAQGGFLWKAIFNQQGTATDLAGHASQVAAADASIMTNAAEAAAAAYASTAAIPVVGPELAPAAAAAAYSQVSAFVGLASLDVGTNFVPNDMLAMVHQGERVIPAADNSALISALNGGGAGGGDSYTININAVDAQSVQRLFAQNGSALVSALAAQKRGMNPFFNGART